MLYLQYGSDVSVAHLWCHIGFFSSVFYSHVRAEHIHVIFDSSALCIDFETPVRGKCGLLEFGCKCKSKDENLLKDIVWQMPIQQPSMKGTRLQTAFFCKENKP